MHTFSHKDLISLDLLSAEDLTLLLDEARRLRTQLREEGSNDPLLAGRILAMVFEKSSLRTRVTFEVGMLQLGGTAIYLSQTNFKLGERETVPDVAHNLERWVDGIMLRTFAHQNVLTMAQAARIPVINGLSDDAHPCQALADLLTIWDHKQALAGIKLAYVGDGNNVAASLAYACALSGMHLVCASPQGYTLDQAVVEQARKIAVSGATVTLTDDPREAVRDADCVYTDVWTSMGQEAEKEIRLKAFQGYQINEALLAGARPDAIVLHCLPAHRGEEISAAVMDGSQSVVFDQAENRLHAQKAVLSLLLGAD